LLAGLALVATCWSLAGARSPSGDSEGTGGQRYWAGWRNELTLLLPAAVVFLLVSSQLGFTIHLRYALPCLPFGFIWISKVARSLELGQRGLAFMTCIALAGSVASSLWCYPFSLSYFNELAGGPTNGHRHLLDSNIDWGQDGGMAR
jgi:hypothetical protein